MSSDEDFENFDNIAQPSTTSADKFEPSLHSRASQLGRAVASPTNRRKLPPPAQPAKRENRLPKEVHHSDEVYVEPGESDKPQIGGSKKIKTGSYYLGTKKGKDPISTSTAQSDLYGIEDVELEESRSSIRPMQFGSRSDPKGPKTKQPVVASSKNAVSAQDYKQLRTQVLGHRGEDREAEEMRRQISRVNLPKIGKGVYKLSTAYLPSSLALYNNCRKSLELVDGTNTLHRTVEKIMEPQPHTNHLLQQMSWSAKEGKSFFRLSQSSPHSADQSEDAKLLKAIDTESWSRIFKTTEVPLLEYRDYLECDPLNSDEYFEGLFKHFLNQQDQHASDADVSDNPFTKTERWTTIHEECAANSDQVDLTRIEQIFQTHKSDEKNFAFFKSADKFSSLGKFSTIVDEEDDDLFSDPLNFGFSGANLNLQVQVEGKSEIPEQLSKQQEMDKETILSFANEMRRQKKSQFVEVEGLNSWAQTAKNTLFKYKVCLLVRKLQNKPNMGKDKTEACEEVWMEVDPFSKHEMAACYAAGESFGPKIGNVAHNAGLGVDKKLDSLNILLKPTNSSNFGEFMASESQNVDLVASTWYRESKMLQQLEGSPQERLQWLSQARTLQRMAKNNPCQIDHTIDKSSLEERVYRLDRLAEDHLGRLDVSSYIATKQLAEDITQRSHTSLSFQLASQTNRFGQMVDSVEQIISKPMLLDMGDQSSQYNLRLCLPTEWGNSGSSLSLVADQKHFDTFQKPFLSKLKKDLKKYRDARTTGSGGDDSGAPGTSKFYRRGLLDVSSPELKCPHDEIKAEDKATAGHHLHARPCFPKQIRHSAVALRFEFRNFSMPKELVKAGFKFDIRKVLSESGKLDTRNWRVSIMKNDQHRKLLKTATIERNPSHSYSYAVENVDSSTYFQTYNQLSCTDPSPAILFEYLEETPLVRSGIGMGTRLTKYYYPEKIVELIKRQNPTLQLPKDQVLEFRKLINRELGLYGEDFPMKPNTHLPTAGTLSGSSSRIGATMIENNMFVAPVASQQPLKNDFLLIRTVDSKGRTRYVLRRIKTIYTVGQGEPKDENFCPYTNRYRNFLRRMLIDRINFEFRKNKMIDVVSLAKNFPVMDLNLLKKFVRTLGGDNRTKDSRYYTYSEAVIKDNLISGDLNFEDLDVTITPEEMCWFESMCSSNYRLTELGITKLKAAIDLGKVRTKFIKNHLDQPRECAIMQFIIDELSLTSWNLSQQYRLAIESRKRMALGGIGDPTNGNGGISFLKATQNGENGLGDIPGSMSDTVVSSSINSTKATANTGSSTNNSQLPKDLRKISMKSLNGWLSSKFGYSTEILNEMSRKDKLVAYKNISTGNVSSSSKSQELVENYKKQIRLNIKAQWQQYYQELNRRLERQLEVISGGSWSGVNSDLEEDTGDLEEQTVKISDKKHSEEPEVGSKSTPSSSSTRQFCSSRSPPQKQRGGRWTRSPGSARRRGVGARRDSPSLEAARKQAEITRKTRELESEIARLKEKLKEGDDLSNDEQEETPQTEDLPVLPVQLQEENIFVFESCDIEF